MFRFTLGKYEFVTTKQKKKTYLCCAVSFDYSQKDMLNLTKEINYTVG